MIDELAATIGIDAMLAPLAGETPVGTDLRTDFGAASPYYRLRDARAEARAAERAADAVQGDEAAMPLEWRSVRQLAIAALTNATKDLEIAAWLTEALVRGEGIAGLAVGAKLMQGLVSNFWQAGLFPLADEDGVVTRVAPVTGLNGEGGDGTLVQPLRKQVFFRQPDGTQVAFWEFNASLLLQGEADAKKRSQRIAAGVKPFADLERDAKAAGAGTFAALRHELRTAHAAWTALGETLDQAAGADSPPTGRVKAILEEMLEATARFAPPEDAVPEPAAETAAAGTAATPVAPAAARAESREDMLRELGRIADYFRRTEPHSPLAYTLDEAVRRGRMSWPDLLSEIVPDTNQRAQMLMQLGIRPAS
jgi:type VI secretion system protein ImpA